MLLPRDSIIVTKQSHLIRSYGIAHHGGDIISWSLGAAWQAPLDNHRLIFVVSELYWAVIIIA